MSAASKCPFAASAQTQAMAGATSNANWWPNQLNLKVLHPQNPLSNPLGEAFNYAQAFKTLDLNAVIDDLKALMTTRKTGGPLTTATTARFSFAWLGTARAPTGSQTVAAARVRAASALRH